MTPTNPTLWCFVKALEEEHQCNTLPTTSTRSDWLCLAMSKVLRKNTNTTPCLQPAPEVTDLVWSCQRPWGKTPMQHLAYNQHQKWLTLFGHVEGLDEEFQHLLRLFSLFQLVPNGSIDPVQVDTGIHEEADVASLHIVLGPVLLVLPGQVIVGLKVLRCFKVLTCPSRKRPSCSDFIDFSNKFWKCSHRHVGYPCTLLISLMIQWYQPTLT